MPEIFQYSFMVRALVAGLVIGLVAPMLGMFLVLRRMSFFPDTLAHTALLGVALGILLDVYPVLAAAVVCVIAAVAAEQLRVWRRLYSEATLALFLSGSLALAIVIMSLGRGLNVNLLSYLFGSITTVQTVDLWVMAALGAVAVGVVLLFFKELFYISFDEESAKVSGLPTRNINLLLTVIAAVIVALAMRIVGILLVGALMVIPVLAGLQIGKSFRRAMVLSVAFSVVSVLAGVTASFYLDVAAGGAIVMVALAFFLVSLLFRRA